jgi:hypothetical protein
MYHPEIIASSRASVIPTPPILLLLQVQQYHLHVSRVQQLLQVLQVQPQHQHVRTAHHSTAGMMRMAQR